MQNQTPDVYKIAPDAYEQLIKLMQPSKPRQDSTVVEMAWNECSRHKLEIIQRWFTPL